MSQTQTAVPLVLTDEDRAELARWSQGSSPMLAERARIVLAGAEPGAGGAGGAAAVGSVGMAVARGAGGVVRAGAGGGGAAHRARRTVACAGDDLREAEL